MTSTFYATRSPVSGAACSPGGRIEDEVFFFGICRLLLLLIVLAAPRPGQAQDTGRFSFVLRGAPLEAALRELITTTRLDLAYDPSLVAGKVAYCAIEMQPPEDVLRCILRGTGLDFYRLSSGLYVLTEAPEAPPLLGTLHGIVLDAETGAPLPNAHVLLADGSTGAVSNEAGRFLFASLRPGYYRVTTSYLGYRQRVDSVWVPPQGTGQARLTLDAEPILVAPVVVDGMQWRLPSDSLGAASASQQRLLAARTGGSPDVAQSLGTLVGVRLSDATADLHVQGGETGEHQFRLDGAPVFVPISIGGLVGPFSPFAIGRVTVHKTGFGAEVGSQSAGVIEAEHALGQAAAQTLDVQVDPLSLNARLGLGAGTPGRTHAALMLAGRFGLWDLYAPSPVRNLLEDWNRADPFMLAAFTTDASQSTQAPIFRREFSTGNPDVGFYDFHAAARIRFGALRSLHASAYLGRRALDSEHNVFEPVAANAPDFAADAAPRTRDFYAWNNGTAQLRYETVLSARLLASVRARASLFRLRHDLLVQETVLDNGAVQARIDPRADNDNRIQEYAVAATLDVAPLNGWHLEAGVEPIYTFSRFLVQGTQRIPISHHSSGWRLASFLTNRFTLSRRLTAEAGARFTYLATQQAVFAEPRLALRYDAPGGPLGPWSFRVATGLFRQFVNQFDVSSRSARTLLATSRTWLAVDATVRPPLSAHLSGEMLLRPAAGWTLRLEGYLKQHLHLLAVNYSAGRPGSDGTQNEALQGLPSLPLSTFLADGEGHTYGAALLLQKQWRRFHAEARYEYSEARRSFGLFFLGNTVPAPWNEPHRLELALDWMPASGLTLVSRWRGIWGRTWGFRQSYYDFLGAFPTLNLRASLPEDVVLNITEQIRRYGLAHPQDHRLPAFHQLDLSAAYTQRLGRVMLQTRLDLLNVLDRDNVADWRFVLDPDFYREHGLLRRENRLLLPFTPSLAVRLAW